MKKLILIFFSISVFSQVPNTPTFSLLDVKNEIGSSVNSLSDAFANAVTNGFDSNYEGSKTSLLNFRNYSHNTSTTQETFSFTTTDTGILNSFIRDNYNNLPYTWVSTGGLVSSGSNTIDLTGNTGVATVTVTVTGVLTYLILANNNLTSINITNNPNLELFMVANNHLTSVDISNNSFLIATNFHNNILTPTAINTIIIALDSFGKSNGNIEIDAGRTTASATAYANLITKNWSITEH